MADIELVIKLDEDIAHGIIDGENDEPRNIVRGFQATIAHAIKNGIPLSKGHGRLIDADICLNKAWQNFYKQEDEHEKNIDGYDIMRDRVFEQSGFECCQQTVVNAPTIIEKDKEQEHGT